jgi:hypothetical protein
MLPVRLFGLHPINFVNFYTQQALPDGAVLFPYT